MESGRASSKGGFTAKVDRVLVLSSNISATAGDVNDLTQNKLYSALYRCWPRTFR
jgi:hypothetical protein